MTGMLNTVGKNSLVRGVLGALFLVLYVGTTGEAKDWYVKAKAKSGGDGDKNKPFNSLQQVEAASLPGDTIHILQSPSHEDALDGGIQLKDGQKLVGEGPNVLNANPNSARAKLTNTSGARLDGDIVRLAKNNLVQNIHFDNAYRSSVFGINADGAEILGNLMTNDMAVHDINDIEGPGAAICAIVSGQRVCTGEWPNGYIIYAPQTNHFGAINLVACGPNARVTPINDLLTQPLIYCQFLVPGSGTVNSPVDYVIRGNTVRDSNSDGIMLINDGGVTANMLVDDNIVRDLSQPLPDPAAVGITHVVRSRAITTITIDNSVSNLELTDFVGSNLSPFGNFASDGVVFLDCGVGSVANAYIADLVIENPFLSGDVSNGDSIEIQHRGSTNGVLNIDIWRARLSDPASTNIKLIEAANPGNGIYNVSVHDSEFSMINTAGNEDAQIRYNGTETPATMAVYLTLKNVSITGVGRGIGLTVPIPPATQVLNANNIRSFRIMVEDSSLSDLTGEALLWWQGAAGQLGTTADPPIFDFGGGPLGSQGRNRFVHNGDPNYTPPGANGAAIDRRFDADFSVRNDRPAPANPAIQVWANNNYWGGGAPVVGTSPAGQDVYIPAGSNVTFTATTFLTVDPQ